jgi:16S rRNA (guanine527-N7)-methyltransferase
MYTLPENYFSQINSEQNVSRETFLKLEQFINLLLKWNKSINLVSKNHGTPEDIWNRHILDSAQLAQYIPANTKTITDFGSGGGFPGIVLAILSDWTLHLIESDGRKCAFLTEAKTALGLNNVIIHNDRIESLKVWESDVITARALAPLDKLLELTHNFYQKTQLCIFLKGQNVVEEISNASTSWDITYEIYPSKSNIEGRILRISNIKQRGIA